MPSSIDPLRPLTATAPTCTENHEYSLRLTAGEWTARAAVHRERVTALSAAHIGRRARGERHPVEDFLWTYYSVKPGELARWHPGSGVLLAGAAAERGNWKYYVADDDDARVDLCDYFGRRAATVNYIEELLTATLARTPNYGCFGLHEWAMVHGSDPEEIRHMGLPLRIGHAATDEVVNSHRIACSHFDAYRFFTPSAAPLNALTPTRATQVDLEQSGCLHAGMDVYKWAVKLGPIIPGELLLDCFVLARDIREVDMRASPYDVSGFTGSSGEILTPIAIETPSGKANYAAEQRAFAQRGNALRARVLEAIARAKGLFSATSAEPQFTSNLGTSQH